MASVRPPLVGRGRELSILLDSLDQAATQGGVILIGGEPGIGKTRLVSEFADRARAAGWRVFFGHADESGVTFPYLPFVEALRDYVRTCSLEDLRAQLVDGAQEVALLVREVRSRFPDLEDSPTGRAEHERYRLFESVSEFLLNVARAAPGTGLVLVLDDLQWADKPSLLLLLHLARKLAAAPLLVVGTYRTIGLQRTAPISDALAELNRERLARRLVLRPLTRDETALLVDGLIGAPASGASVEAILEQTEGNPFFIEEVVRDLQAEGHDLQQPANRTTLQIVPEGVRYVIGKRLSRLSDAANRVLQFAAILGDGFSFGSLDAVLGSSDQDLVDALEELLGAGLVQESEARYRFTHALIRQTVLSDLSAPRRVRRHQQVAEALERIYATNVEPHLSELAHHFLEGSTAGGLDKAVDYARRAGDRSMDSLAYEDAARLYERAIAVDEQRGPTAGELRVRLRLALGDALRRAGELHRAMETHVEAWQNARVLDRSDLLAQAAIGYEAAMLPTGLPRQGLSEPSVVLQDQALRALGDEDSVLRATLLASLAQAVYFAGSPERAAQLSDEAIVVAQRAGDRRVLACALRSRCCAIWGPEHTEERLQVAADFARIAEEVGDRELALDGYEWLIRGQFEVGDVAGLDRAMSAYARLTREVRQPRYYHQSLSWDALRALVTGRFDEAERVAKRAAEIGAGFRSQNAEIYYITLMLALRRDQGRMDELAQLERSLGEVEAQHPLKLGLRALHAKVNCDLGQIEEARRAFERFAASRFAEVQQDWLKIPHLLFLSSTCAVLEDADRAATLYALLLPFARRYNTEGGCLSAAARYLGLLAVTMGESEKAAAHFAEAIELNRRIGAAPSVAHSQFAYASMLWRRGRGEDVPTARALVEEARTSYAGLDMRYDLAQADALLTRLTSSPAPDQPPVFPDGLTAREVEVLRLIAAGRSNREIADGLVLSVRTVERHITNLYRKIDARGKADATAYALARGLVSPRPHA